MSMRMDLDFRHGLTEPRITRGADGPTLSLTRGQEMVVVHLSLPSLEALALAVLLAMAEYRRS